MQETFTYLLRKFPGFVLTCSLMTFLYPAVKNFSIVARRKRLRMMSGAEISDDFLAPPASGEPSDLAQALSGLSGLHREIILMRFVDELSLEEISQALERYRERQRQRDVQTRRQELLSWFGEYHRIIGGTQGGGTPPPTPRVRAARSPRAA